MGIYYGYEIFGLSFSYMSTKSLPDGDKEMFLCAGPPGIRITLEELRRAGYSKPFPELVDELSDDDLEELFVIADKVLVERFGEDGAYKAINISSCLRVIMCTMEVPFSSSKGWTPHMSFRPRRNISFFIGR